MATLSPISAFGSAADRAFDPPREVAASMRIEHGTFESWPVFTATSSGEPPRGRLLYLHGGGHVSEITPLHWVFIARLVHATGWQVIVPNFPVVPQATHHEVYPRLRSLWSQVASTALPTAIVGDSSGGTLALALLQSLSPDQRPGHTVLLSPWLDAVLDNPDIAAIEPHDPMNNQGLLRRFAQLFAGGDDLAIAEVSPIRGPLDHLGQLTVFAGTHDILTADARLLARTAAPGTTVDLREYPGQTHVWMLLAEQAGEAIAHDIAAVLA